MYKQGKSTIGEKPTQMRRSHGWNYSEGGLKGGAPPMFDENKRGARLLRIVQQRAAGALTFREQKGGRKGIGREGA